MDGQQGIVKEVNGNKVTYLTHDDKLATVNSSEISEAIAENAKSDAAGSNTNTVDKRYNNFSEKELMELEERGFKTMFTRKVKNENVGIIFYKGDNVIFKRSGKVYLVVDGGQPFASVDLKGALSKAKAA